MIWTEQIPTVPGWYWQKDTDGSSRIIYYPHYGTWPKSAAQRKQEHLDSADDDEMRSKLERMNWIVKWAGPIPMPDET